MTNGNGNMGYFNIQYIKDAKQKKNKVSVKIYSDVLGLFSFYIYN